MRKDARGRAYATDRAGKRISVKEANRRNAIGAYAKRRVRGKEGRYEKKVVVVTARKRDRSKPREPKETERLECSTDAYVVEVDVEDPTEDEILKALDDMEEGYAHFGVSDVAEVDE